MPLVLDTSTASYQTAPLTNYSPALQHHAATLYDRVCELVGPEKCKEFKGSYSFFGSRPHETVAKILIFEIGKGKLNGDFPPLADGVYALFRAEDAASDRIFQDLLPSSAPSISEKLDRTLTIGVAPTHQERFAYLRFTLDEFEEIAQALAVCTHA